jgi:hypothetical protein
MLHYGKHTEKDSATFFRDFESSANLNASRHFWTRTLTQLTRTSAFTMWSGRYILLIGHLLMNQAFASVITTANCNFNRKTYNAELQLFYSYMVEFEPSSNTSLGGKTQIAVEESAIHSSLIHKNNVCW